MTAASGAFGQRFYGTRRNLLLSHSDPGQPRRPHAPCTGKGCLTESIPAAPVDEPRIARGLGVTCVPAGDGSRRRRLPRRRAGVRHKSSLSAQPAATMSESSNERISGHRSATVSSASSASGYSRTGMPTNYNFKFRKSREVTVESMLHLHVCSTSVRECWFGKLDRDCPDGLVYLCGVF